jgi:hypothetical protein
MYVVSENAEEADRRIVMEKRLNRAARRSFSRREKVAMYSSTDEG